MKNDERSLILISSFQLNIDVPTNSYISLILILGRRQKWLMSLVSAS